ncbi:8-oxo-dGTP diphosphatase MutT [Pleionea sediminis]|uniref:8-oxo-dGTP diphosphatase MutT n=1 Tax=Pleionea sediminis TaxID=2569479 RepID=UPI00197BFE40|nr:8-oxo-dGTP diphosphatase MutT [Pleionea sediminis]
MIKVVAAIITADDKVLLSKRPKSKHQGNKWEFPGGKVDSGETFVEALMRECKEELGISIQEPLLFDSIKHHYTDKSVELHFYSVRSFDGSPRGMEGQEVQWFSILEIERLEFPEANKAIVTKLLNEFIN